MGGDIRSSIKADRFTDEPLHSGAVLELEAADGERRGNLLHKGPKCPVTQLPNLDLNGYASFRHPHESRFGWGRPRECEEPVGRGRASG